MKRATSFFKKFTSNKIPRPSPEVVSFNVHGDVLEDPFRWLHNLQDSRVGRYINQENVYCKNYFNQQDVNVYFDSVYTELLDNESENIETVPEYAFGFYYYTREEAGKNFPMLCRKKSLSGPEEVFLDSNEEGSGSSYVSVKAPVFSRDQMRMAFAKCDTPEEKYQGIVRDIKTKKTLDIIPSVYSMIFADSNHIIYTKQDHLRRPYQVVLHKIGSNIKDDKILYQEADDSFFLDITLSKDNEYAIISSNAKDTSEVRLLSTSNLSSKPLLVHERKDKVKFFLDHAEGTFYAVTNDNNAPNFKIIVSNAKNLLSKIHNKPTDIEKDWDIMVPDRKDASILDVDIFKNNIVTYVSDVGRHQILIYDKKNIKAPPHCVKLPSEIGYVEPGGNVDYNSDTLRFSFSSPVHPDMIFDLDLKSKSLQLKQQEELHTFSPSEYICERIEVESKDGTVIPVTITRDLNYSSRREKLPILLHVYGAYGHNIEPRFRDGYIPLWRRGWSIATVHVRGGGEKGALWHQGGSYLNKLNSISDFIDSTKYIRDNKLADTSKICASTSSAGGLILGAACNNYPHLYNSIIMKVPFVDSLYSMLDEELPLTICEYPEWGNPSKEKEVFELMKSYDPYLNLKNISKFPSIYATTSTLDYQVPFWGPLKWMAKIRQEKDYSKTALIHVSKNTAHGGDGGRISSQSETAREISFLLHQTKSSVKPLDSLQ